MEQEEILEYSAKLIDRLGPDAEDLFSLGCHYERIAIFSKLRDLIVDKEALNDNIASETLAWAWEKLSE